MSTWRIVAITYELSPGSVWMPVVEHRFYGPTPERAEAVYRAHLQSDRFLHDCQYGAFGEVTCQTTLYAPERVG